MKVKFLRKYRKWKEGDVEDFKEKKALYLIRTGWADKYVQKRRRKPKEDKNGKPKTEDK